MSESNKHLTPLECRKMPQVAKALRAARPTILRRWDEMIRDTLPEADALTTQQVRDSIPIVLEQIAVTLESASRSQTDILLDVTREHGVVRFHEHYSIHDLLVEYRYLRTVVLEEVWEPLWKNRSRQRRDESLALNAALDLAIQQAVTAFSEHQQRSIRAANEKEARYLSFLSHDLRNNLNHILLTLESITLQLQKCPDLHEEHESLNSARHAIWETMDGMERLMQAERLNRKAVEARLVLLRPRDLADRLLTPLINRALERGIVIHNEIPTELVIKSDEQLLALILQNLIGNAIKYTEKGHVTLRTLQDKKHGPRWGIAIIDTGRGIAPEDKERIFDAFRRGESHGTTGAGLGLAIASAAATLLGAAVTLESSPGKGSQFTVWLPEEANDLSSAHL